MCPLGACTHPQQPQKLAAAGGFPWVLVGSPGEQASMLKIVPGELSERRSPFRVVRTIPSSSGTILSLGVQNATYSRSGTPTPFTLPTLSTRFAPLRDTDVPVPGFM